MKRGLGFMLALGVCLAMPMAGRADSPAKIGKAEGTARTARPAQKGPLDDVTCTFVGYEAATSRLTVTLAGLPTRKATFGAAALDKGEEGGIWVQVGQDLKADGEVTFEASDFHGKAYVFLARNPAGKAFLAKAQKGSASGKPTSARLVKRAAITPVCTFDLP